MDALLSELSEVTQQINRTEINFKKIAKANLNLATAKSRLELLDQRWRTCENLHLQIKNLSTSAEREKIDYFTKSKFLTVEESYLTAHDFLINQIHLLTPETANESLNQSTAMRHDFVPIKLPQIVLPEFDGDYKNWENFRDLFNSLIIQNDSLSNVTRLHYLKSSLKGEAAQLVKHVAITEVNFRSTWESLKARFDNKRALINAHLQAFINLPNIQNNSFEELRNLRDTTNESLAALNNLNRSTANWSDLLVFLIVKKLDFQTFKEWEMLVGSSTDYPTFKELDVFLERRIRVLEAIHASKNVSSDKIKNSKAQSVRSHAASVNSKCLLCKENHALFRCSQFKAQSIDKRLEIAKKNRCCFNCLTPGHKPYFCSSKYTCAKCHRKHNTLLHYATKNDSNVADTSMSQPSTSSHSAGFGLSNDNFFDSSKTGECQVSMVNTNHVSLQEQKASVQILNSHKNDTGNKSLLATALVDVKADNGRIHSFRVLLDQGSECCFASERAVKILSPRYDRINARVYGVGGSEIGSAKKLAHFQFLPKEKGCKVLSLQALVLLQLSSYSPPVRLGGGNEIELKKLLLADPEPFSSSQIDFILGADKFGSCLLPGLKQGVYGTLTAQATMFGWILSGMISNDVPLVASSISAHHCLSTDVVHDVLKRFWELEELPSQVSLTEDELNCEKHFVSTHRRLPSGRYVVRLPFKDGPPINIGNSLGRAKIVLNRVLHRLSEKPELSAQYSEFMTEYEELGHMRRLRVDVLKDLPQVVYLPHHPVLRESSSTTKLRVVFNAASPTSNNSSLNSHFHIGPKILTDLVSIIMRWREHRYVYVADVEKMFRQILIDPKDLDYQRILWQSSEKEIVAYQLLTVTYGTACAPYLANRVIKQLAQDEGSNYPLAQSVLEQNVYVDDVLFGADDVIEAKEIREQVAQLMERGGFHLRKWASNDRELLDECPLGRNERALELPLAEDIQLKILGLHWDPGSDSFQIKVTSEDVQTPTKRIVLSIIAKLYDPLGWLTPVIVVAKILMQELWLRKLDWDEKLPDDLSIHWLKYYSSLPKLELLRIPRWIGQLKSSSFRELHGFSDASTKAYAATVYLRIFDEFGNADVTLLFAKSRVAPITPVSIPRLELCGAVLLAKSMKLVISNMGLDSLPHYCHTDSTVVLAWLSKHPSTWKPFVANRVALIHELVPRVKWRHVPTKENPADYASRGLFSEGILDNKLWWHGPVWLAKHSTSWPDQRSLVPPMIDLEQRPQSSHHVAGVEESMFDLFDKFSSWPKLTRVTAYCIRFIQAFTKKYSEGSQSVLQYESRALQMTEIEQARLFWIKFIQQDAFAIELKELNRGGELPVRSSLRLLNPFLDSSGVLRLGGRLRYAPISYDEKHPIILPRHKISELIASHAHLRSLHGGSQLTLHTLRQNFWILGARSLVKSLLKNCVTCARERAAVPQQLMGDLPQFRITPSRPFSHTGVDYAGPFDVRFASGRGQKSHKTYVSLFICCITRAVHLELVTDYSSSAFLAAFHRFISRRGRPSNMYSDNGKTFEGANNELKKWLLKFRKDYDLFNQLVSDGTAWHFVPPSAPHFGGLWEAGVKSVKHHLRRIVGEHKFTYEEFYTLLTCIEANLNSRPIAPLSTDPEDFAYLTPGHFLVGAPISSVPEPSLEFIPENRLSRWELVQRISQTFWRRWSVDYLHTLQKRYKWKAAKVNIKMGDMVLLRQDNLPPSKWLLGRVTESFPGKDNLVRTVKVKTADSEFVRPIAKLCLLPIKSNDSSELI